MFEFVIDVEMVFDCVFVVFGYKFEFVNVGFCCFFDVVLYQWFVDNWQDFFGYGFGGGQKVGVIVGYGKQVFFDYWFFFVSVK